MKPIHIFFSYAHEDEKFREELEKHLAFLKRDKKIIEWHDRRLLAGSNWEKEIIDNIDQAQIIVMLMSPDFISSDYCSETESKRALERHSREEAIVVPVIIRPCLWTQTPFKNLQALPKDGVPVSTFKNHDEAWLEVAKGLLKVINKLLKVEVSEGALPISHDPINGSSEKEANKKYEEQLIRFLSEYKKYWFTPVKIKSMAVQVSGAKDLSVLEVGGIIACCDALTQQGLLSTMRNAKGDNIYKIK